MSVPSSTAVQVDIVSDVVCPWCIIGFKQLEQALAVTGLGSVVRWHPFELNPAMPQEGQDLRAHLAEKYGTTPEQSRAVRDRLTALGAELGFTFNYGDGMRMVNTFRAHQLLDWALEQNRQHPLKLELFKAVFTDVRDVSDISVLVELAESVGLDGAEALDLLERGAFAEETRIKQKFWTDNGISGVPAMVFDGKYLLTGAQGVDTYVDVLRRCVAEAA